MKKIKSAWNSLLDSFEAIFNILFFETQADARLRRRIEDRRSLTVEQALARDRLKVEEDLNRVIRRELRRKQ